MNRRLLHAVCVILSALLLTGCQLARAETGTETEPDRLVGVFITREYLDLFDIESYFEDNSNKILSSGLIDDKSDEYNGRVYATQKDGRLNFGDLDGIALFSGMMSDSDGPYNMSYADDGINDISFGNSSLAGTVYTTPGIRSFYLNPIYQSPDGSVYLKSGTGITDDGGGTVTQSIAETQTITENGIVTEESFNVSVSFSTKSVPERIVVTQMDKTNNPIHREEFDPSAIPDEISRHADAEYILVETYSTSPEGEQAVTREFAEQSVYDGNLTFTVYLPREDGICVARTVTVK